MMWAIQTTDIFDTWFDALNDADRTNVLAALMVLREHGPQLARPYADTVYGSTHANMKELRIQSKGRPLRTLFAFDPQRTAIILCAGDKAGNEKRFYKQLIPLADRIFTEHLEQFTQ